MGEDSQDEALMREVDNRDQIICYSCQKHFSNQSGQILYAALIMFSSSEGRSFFAFVFYCACKVPFMLKQCVLVKNVINFKTTLFNQTFFGHLKKLF